jgi:hypothetical protein
MYKPNHHRDNFPQPYSGPACKLSAESRIFHENYRLPHPRSRAAMLPEPALPKRAVFGLFMGVLGVICIAIARWHW